MLPGLRPQRISSWWGASLERNQDSAGRWRAAGHPGRSVAARLAGLLRCAAASAASGDLNRHEI